MRSGLVPSPTIPTQPRARSARRRASLLFLTFLALAPVSARGQGVSPSMAETASWLRENLPIMGDLTTRTRVDAQDTKPTRMDFSQKISEVELDRCVLRYQQAIRVGWIHKGRKLPEQRTSYFVSVPLNAVDLAAVSTYEQSFYDGVLSMAGNYWISERPPASVIVKAFSPSSAPFVQLDLQERSRKGLADLDLIVRNLGEAERVARAIRHAAQLCGARASPF